MARLLTKPIWFLIAGAVLACLPSGAKAQSSSAVVLGSCNIVQQNLSVAKGSTVINQLDCVPPTLEDSFSLRYVWLDAKTSSLLTAGFFDSSLRPVIGNMQSVLRNSVYHRLDEIVRRFGNPIGTDFVPIVGKGQPYSLTGARGEVSIDNKGDHLPLSALKKLKLYGGEQTILLPDTSALRSIKNTQGWPADYKLTYGDEAGVFPRSKTKQDVENSALMCALLYKPITKEILANYWTDVELLESLIEKKEFRQDQVVNSNVNAGTGDFRVAALQNQALPAMAYFTEKNWPEDFLMGFGSAFVAQCGEGYSIGFYALPRKLFTLVAVIEAKSNSIEIQGMSFDLDPTDGLHLLTKGEKTEAAPPGSIVLKRGETVLVPLRIELRYDLEVAPIATLVDGEAAGKLYSKIVSLPNASFQFRGKDVSNETNDMPPAHTIFTKSKAAFRPPETAKITQSYVFGPSYDLKDIVLKGKAIAVRSAPASALVFVGETGIGSCPFLFVDDDQNSYVKVGRMLVGANDESRSREEIIKLAPGTRSLYLSEQEPEITYVEQIAIRDAASGFEEVLARNVVLRPGWSRKFDVPERMRADAQLVLRGYYKRLELRDAAVR
jgi:hypothetical protein